MKFEKHKLLDHFYFPGDVATIKTSDGTEINIDAKTCIEIIVKSVKVLNNEQIQFTDLA